MANLRHLSRVLVCEDEALILMDIEATLREAGVADILSGLSVAEGEAHLAAHDCDAAILDRHLGSDGWSDALAHRLRAKGVPFVFLSGTVEVADGFRDVPLVMKPFSTDQLVAALLQVTAGGRNEAAE
jgi:DNA-binding response OmpR family regulator